MSAVAISPVPQGIDNLEQTCDIYFDNWMINKNLLEKRILPQVHQNSYLDNDYIDRNLGYIRGQPGIDNRAIGSNYDDSEATRYATEYCREVIGLGEQLQYVEDLWNSKPGDKHYNLRESLRNYVTTSQYIQQISIAEGKDSNNEDIINLDKIFRNIPFTKKSFVVYRIFAQLPAHIDLARPAINSWSLNHRYMSTSLSKTNASGYAGVFEDPINRDSRLIKIVIPPNSKVIPILNYTKWSRDSANLQRSGATSSEFEILVPRHNRLYLIPDKVKHCIFGKKCKTTVAGNTCQFPHFYREYRLNSNDREISATLSSLIERSKIKKEEQLESEDNKLLHAIQFRFSGTLVYFH